MAVYEWTGYDRVLRGYEARWKKADDALYGLCGRHPLHDDLAGLYAKLLIIGRTYATGIERHMPAGLRAADRLVALLRQQRLWLDKDLRRLRQANVEVSFETINALATVHGRLLKAITKVTRDGNEPRSFVSKYLHFHAPAFPIFDSIALKRISSRDWYPWTKKWSTMYAQPKLADPLYWRYCVRLAHMANDWRDVGLAPTPRLLDVYIVASA